MGYYDNKNLIKKALIFGFFLLFFILLGNSSSYCSFNFTGLDTNDYELPDLPDVINNDTHFFVCRTVGTDANNKHIYKILANNNLDGFQGMVNNTYHKYLFLYNGANGYSSSSNLYYTCRDGDTSWTLQTLEMNNNNSNYNLYITGFSTSETLIYSTDDVYSYNQSNKPSNITTLPIYAQNNKINVVQVLPTIENNSSTIENWSFKGLVINFNDVGAEWVENNIHYEPNWWELQIDFQGVVYSLRLDDYFVIKNDFSSGSVIVVPKNQISQFFNIRNGDEITFTLVHYKFINNRQFRIYNLPTYTFTLTTEEEEEINQDSQTQAINNINNNLQQTNQSINNLNNTQQQTNNKLDNIDNTLTDSTVDSDVADDLLANSEIVINDPTGLDNIFMILYNAFCTDEIQNCTLTIPFVNKTITLNRQNISARFPTAVTSIVGLCVWGIIGLFVLKDIRGIINKIKEGNIENTSGDVKKEVL